MTEHHVHFQQAAHEESELCRSYGERTISEKDRAAWVAMLVAQMDAAFASVKTLPVDPKRPISFSITVKQ